MRNNREFHTTLPQDVLFFIKKEAEKHGVKQNVIVERAVREYAENLARKKECECLYFILKNVVKKMVREEVKRIHSKHS